MSSANSQSNKGGQTCEGCQPDKHGCYGENVDLGSNSLTGQIVNSTADQLLQTEQQINAVIVTMSLDTAMGLKFHARGPGNIDKVTVDGKVEA